MRQIVFHFDFISPFAYLAFEKLPRTLEGLSYHVHYRPLLLGALLKHHGQLAPAQVLPKRAWIYRHALWLGHANGIAIDMPASHPYNPLAHLRLALATSRDGEVNRYVTETIFRDIWRGGAEAGDPARLAALAGRLPTVRDLQGDEVKAQLRRNTEAALQTGVFGTPSFEVDGKLFWGFDSLPMLRAYLDGDVWFDGPPWAEAPQRPSWVPGQ